MINYDDFKKIDLRVGTVIAAQPNVDAHKPAYILEVDFGELGIKKTSAQITDKYPNPEALINKQIIAVVNFPPKQIAKMMSECLVLGAVEEGEVTLIQPDSRVKNGLRIL